MRRDSPLGPGSVVPLAGDVGGQVVPPLAGGPLLGDEFEQPGHSVSADDAFEILNSDCLDPGNS